MSKTIIRIAGTNGKTAVASYLAAALTAAEYDAVANTALSEDGVSEEVIIDLPEDTGKSDTRGTGDVAVQIINTLTPDPTNGLGDTPLEIAGNIEKLIRPGVTVIMNVKDEAANDYLTKLAQERGVKLIDITGEQLKYVRMSPFSTTFDGIFPEGTIEPAKWEDLHTTMAGRHQCHNILMTVACIRVLEDMGLVTVPKVFLYKGIRTVHFEGQFERLKMDPLFPLFGEVYLINEATNPAAMFAMYQTTFEIYGNKRVTHIFGMPIMGDAEDFVETFYRLGSPRNMILDSGVEGAVPAAEMVEALKNHGMQAETVPSLEEALDAGRQTLESKKAHVCLVIGTKDIVDEARVIIKKMHNLK